MPHQEEPDGVLASGRRQETVRVAEARSAAHRCCSLRSGMQRMVSRHGATLLEDVDAVTVVSLSIIRFCSEQAPAPCSTASNACDQSSTAVIKLIFTSSVKRKEAFYDAHANFYAWE